MDTREWLLERDGRRIRARLAWVGRDLVVVVGGGDRPHVGAVAVARPGPGDPVVSVLGLPGHREDVPAGRWAERLCRSTGGTVVVSVGIHQDGLDPGGVRLYVAMLEELLDTVARALPAPPP